MTQENISGYSGQQINGLNTTATYDRMYFNSTLTSVNDIIENWRNSLLNFNNSDRTRLVFNIDIPEDIAKKLIFSDEFSKIFFPGELETFYIYPASTLKAGYANVIISYNKGNRKLIGENQLIIKEKIQSIISRNTFDLDSAIRNLRMLIKDGFQFTTSFTKEELFELWGESFGWTQDALQAELENPTSFTMGLRNEDGNLISVFMISRDGESTEWSTRKGFQGRGYIEPLLLIGHANKIFIEQSNNNGITPIFCDARYNRSVKPGILSGMNLSPGILQNHVTIGGESPDRWNENASIVNGIDFRYLRSFLTMYLGQEMYEPDTVNKILDNSRL